jgi:hypothetical protein
MQRAAKIEVILAKDRKEVWRELCVKVQQMNNRIWQLWLVHHITNGSICKLQEDIRKYHEWEKNRKGKKPTWSVGACDLSLGNHIFRALAEEFPDVHSHTRGQIYNIWYRNLIKRKSPSGCLPGWTNILFANESLPSFTSPQPIPFKTDQARLVRDGKDIVLTVRLELLTKGRAVSDRVILLMGKHKSWRQKTIVDRMLDGTYAWKGSSLVWDRKNRKWFVSLAYEMPQRSRPSLEPSKSLILCPGKRVPWILADSSGAWELGESGGIVVENMRHRLQRERWERQEHYRWAGSAQSGRGRRRAKEVWTKLSSRWKDFEARYNREIAKKAVLKCVDKGIGKLIYFQPVDERKDDRLLETAGRVPNSSLGWDWFKMGSYLANKCEEYGVEYEIRRCLPRVRKEDLCLGDHVAKGA